MTPEQAILQLAKRGIATSSVLPAHRLLYGCKYELRKFAPYLFVSPFQVLNYFGLGVWTDTELEQEAESARAYLPRVKSR